jgi:hypothetical protein
MDEYMINYETFTTKIVYDFRIGYGGIGDLIKFFMHTLGLCIKYKYKLFYLVNDIHIEYFLKLKHPQLYIKKEDMGCDIRSIDTVDEIPSLHNNFFNCVTPHLFYSTLNFDYIYNIQDIFYFTEEVVINRGVLLYPSVSNYISIHLRLGDKYLETEKQFIHCLDDTRPYNEEALFKFIEENNKSTILFFCDNDSYKQNIKNKYKNIIITSCSICHTSFVNSTYKQVLDTITEFYLLVNSEKIYSASYSGFSLVASRFKNIPFISLPN